MNNWLQIAELHQEIEDNSKLLYEMENDGLGGSPDWLRLATEIDELERLAEILDV